MFNMGLRMAIWRIRLNRILRKLGLTKKPTYRVFHSVDEMMAEARKKDEEYKAKTCLLERIINKIKWHKDKVKQDLWFLKRTFNVIKRSKTIYLSETSSECFKPCPKYLDINAKCKCRYEDENQDDIKQEDHYDGKSLSLMDVIMKGDYPFAKWKWTFDVITTKQVKEDEERYKESDKKDKFEKEEFEIEGLDDPTYIEVDFPYITEVILINAVKRWIKDHVGVDREVVWVDPDIVWKRI